VARTAQLLGMQQTVGNQVVQRLLQRDAAATGPATPATLQALATGTPTEAATQEPPALEARLQAAAGGGAPLAPTVQRQLEHGLSADLSQVRVHADPEADHLARAVQATAFTTGPDIYFRAGAYDPGSAAGMRLLAHEAAHTLQQAAGPVSGTPGPGGVALSTPDDPFERAAAAQAAQVLATPAVAGAHDGATAAAAPSQSSQSIQRVVQRAEDEAPPIPATATATATDEAAASATGDTPAVDPAKLSGALWKGIADTNGWLNYSTLDELAEPFKANATAFIAALEAAGADVQISTTKRDIERAWLMHGAWTVANGGAAPQDDPYNTGIVWDHGTPEATKQAAQEMKGPNGFNMAYDASLNSRHFSGNAVDMNITNLPASWTFTHGGETVTVDLGTGAAATNAKLHEAASTYFAVKKLVGDDPHWSDTGG
jgi:hypothetical protein